MDKAVVLGHLKDMHGLVIGDIVALAGLAAVVGKIPDADAPALLVIGAAVAQVGAAGAAGALPDADMPLILLEPVGQMLDIERLIFH